MYAYIESAATIFDVRCYMSLLLRAIYICSYIVCLFRGLFSPCAKEAYRREPTRMSAIAMPYRWWEREQVCLL